MHQNSSGNPLLRRAVHAALAGGSLATSLGVANAQTQSVLSTPSDNALAEVLVTGSRIAVPNQVSISPVTVVSAADIQTSGVTRIEDVLNQLPQVFASQGGFASDASDGTATVNLRGLQAKRTLVLVDGFRLGPGDPTSGAASDINMIPTALIDSVEVLTGGASSVYGADAVGGVVNFKLNDHFEGVKLVAGAGIYSHDNRDTQGVETALNNFNETTGNNDAAAPAHANAGAQKELTFIAGLNSPDGNGNATFYASYRNVAAVLQSKYSISACAWDSGYVAGPSNSGGKFTCSGSSTSYPGRFYDPATGSNNTIGPHGTLIPFTNANLYNFGPTNYFQRPDERYNAGTFLHYDFNEHATVYAQLMFMDDRSLAQISPSGAFFTPEVVNCANPFLSAAELTAWCSGSTAGFAGGSPGGLVLGRRNVEGGERYSDFEHTDFHEVLGVKGKINDAWEYDGSFQYGLVNLSSTEGNYVSQAKLNNALDVVNVGGVPTCVSGPPCVPYNIFTLGQVTPAAVAYLNALGELHGQITQTAVDINFTGDLGKYGIQLPTAGSGLKLNIGAEWRDVKSSTTPDEELQSGDLSGSGAALLPVNGGIVSREGFIEAHLPLMEDMPFAKSLNFDTGYRYSNYNLGFDTNTFKLGLEWSPIQDVRLRGSFSQAVRAPNVVELFSVQSVGAETTIDPCSGSTPMYSAAACARTGVTAAEYGHILTNTAAQYNALLGGNPDLRPETALTTSFGIGFTPSFVPNFRAQIDYFDIKIKNVIQTVGEQQILLSCVQSDLFCSDVHRDNLGSLWLSNNGYVVDALTNVGQLETKGIDLELSYAFDIGALGKIHASLVGTYLDQYEVTPIATTASTAYNCAGYYGTSCSSFTSGAGTPLFRWRNTLRTTWSTPWNGLDVTLSWRYFSPVKVESLSPNANLAAGGAGTIANGGISNTDAYISSYSYFDLTASMKLAEKVTLRLGVNNILDKDPPVVGATNLPSSPIGNGNTMPQVYDSLGRYIFGSIIAQF
jgi:iron complex outermembrane recepter protein